jgi:chemotaxis protein CheD
MRTGPLPRLPPGSTQHLFLMPGAHYCTPEPAIVTTVLGSCVAICLHDRAQGIGGMNHYVLPHNAGPTLNLRYGNMSIDQLIEEMRGLGARVDTLEAKIFGGAAVLPVGAPADSVGTQNVRMALERMRRHHIRVKARRTGGSKGLLIRFSTSTGDVIVRTIEPGAHYRPVDGATQYDSNLGWGDRI